MGIIHNKDKKTFTINSNPTISKSDVDSEYFFGSDCESTSKFDAGSNISSSEFESHISKGSTPTNSKSRNTESNAVSTISLTSEYDSKYDLEIV